MKKTAISAILLLALILTACGNAAAAQWQEQYDLGVRYLSEGDFENAIVAFQAAIEIDPKRAQAYVGVAQAYIGLGDEENAIEWLQKGIETADDTGDIAAMLTELGVEVPEAAAPEGGSTDATQGQSAVPSAQGEGEAAAADEEEFWSDGDETLAAMMRTGLNFASLREEDYTALGVPFFESATLDSLRSAAAAAGLEIQEDDDMYEFFAFEQSGDFNVITYYFYPILADDTTSVTEDGTDTNATSLSFNISCSSEEGYGTPAGTHGIVMWDSFETALAKLGFSNAKEIENYCLSHLNAEVQTTRVRLGEKKIDLSYCRSGKGDSESEEATRGSSLGITIYPGEQYEKAILLDFWEGHLHHVVMSKI